MVSRARDFRRLLTPFVLQALATGCMRAGVDYVAGDVLGTQGTATILFVCFVGPALLLTPLWARVGVLIGKKKGYVASSLVLAGGAALTVIARDAPNWAVFRSEEHTSELQSLMRISYAVFCLKKTSNKTNPKAD